MHWQWRVDRFMQHSRSPSLHQGHYHDVCYWLIVPLAEVGQGFFQPEVVGELPEAEARKYLEMLMAAKGSDDACAKTSGVRSGL